MPQELCWDKESNRYRFIHVGEAKKMGTWDEKKLEFLGNKHEFPGIMKIKQTYCTSNNLIFIVEDVLDGQTHKISHKNIEVIFQHGKIDNGFCYGIWGFRNVNGGPGLKFIRRL